MVSAGIFQFVLQHFALANVGSVSIFNCWPVETRAAFAQNLLARDLFAQFLSINKNGVHDALFRSDFTRFQNPVVGIVFDVNCRHSEEVLSELQSSSLRLFSASYRWLILSEKHDHNLESIRSIFGAVNLSIDADITYALVEAPRRRIDDAAPISVAGYDVYNNGAHIGGQLNITADREWRCNASGCQVHRFLSDLHKRPKYGQRSSLTDVTLRMATMVSHFPLDSPQPEMLAYMNSINNPSVDGLERFGFQITMTFVEMLNCNISFNFTNIWSSGAIFGGAIGEMINGSADLVSTPLISVLPRFKYLALINEWGTSHSICLFRTPRRSVLNGGLFFAPFSTTVWILFAFVLLLAALILWCIFFVESRRLHFRWSYLPSLLSTCLICLGSACFQGSQLIPLSSGGRVAFLSLSLVTFLMYNYYTSLVVSSLLGSPLKSKIKTLGQLADSSLEVGLEPLVYNIAYLNSSTVAEVQKFVRRKMKPRSHSADLWIPVVEGVKRVRDEPGFVYIFDAAVGYSQVEHLFEPHQICDLNEFKLRDGQVLHLTIPKTSSYRELYRLRSLRLLETGIYLKMKRFWVRTAVKCYANNVIIDVGMEQTGPLFLMLLVAILCAIFILLLEIAYKRNTKRGFVRTSNRNRSK